MIATAAARETAELTAARKWTVLGLLWLAMVINYIDRGSLSIAAVPLMKEFGISATAMGGLLSAFFWSYTALQVPAGWVVDRFGIRWTFAVAFLLWSLASAGVGLASSFGQVFALRLLLGCGEAAAQPASLAFIRRSFRDDQQGLPTAVYLSGLAVGPAAGTFLGSLALNSLGWRGMFISLGLGCCLWLLPWLLLAPAETRAPRREADPGAAPAPIQWGRLFSRPLIWGIFIGAFFYSYYWYFCLSWLPSYLVMDRGMDFAQMGIFASIPFLAKVPVSMAAGRLSDWMVTKTGRPILVRKMFVVSGFLLGTCILLLHVVQSQMGAVAILAASLMGLGFSSANYWALTQSVTPPNVTGRIIGVQNTVGNLGGICAPILTGYLVSADRDFGSAISFAGFALVVAAAAYLFLVRERDAGLLRDLFGDR